MADIKLRIEVNADAETETLGNVFNYESDSPTISNVSNVSLHVDSSGMFIALPTEETAISGHNGLSLAKPLIFNSEGYLDNEDGFGASLESEQNPQEFVWGAVPIGNEYHVKLVFDNVENLNKIVVYGDTVANQYPTRAIIDGTTVVTSDDAKWAISLGEPNSTHTVEFTHWNRAEYNACLTLIRVMLKCFDVDKTNGLKLVESQTQSTGQPNELFYGVISNSGSAQLLDINGELEELVKDEIMPNSNLGVRVISNGKTTAEHISTDSTYDNNSKVLDISLSDNLSLWKVLQYGGYNYPGEPRDSYTLLVHVLSSIGYSESQIEEMLSQEIVFGDKDEIGSVKDYLSRIIIEYPYLEKDTIKNTIDKFCRLAQLQVFQKDNGNPIFVSARPIATDTELDSALNIPKNCQLSQLSKAIILKNKYDAVEIDVKDVLDEELLRETLANEKVDYISSAFSSVEDVSRGRVLSNGFNPTKAWGVRLIQKDYYVNGVIEIPKKQNYDLETRLRIYDEYPFETFSIIADEIKGTSECVIGIDENDWSMTDPKSVPASFVGNTRDTETEREENVIRSFDFDDVNISVEGVSVSITPNNDCILSVESLSDRFVVHYQVVAYRERWELKADGVTEFLG